MSENIFDVYAKQNNAYDVSPLNGPIDYSSPAQAFDSAGANSAKIRTLGEQIQEAGQRKQAETLSFPAAYLEALRIQREKSAVATPNVGPSFTELTTSSQWQTADAPTKQMMWDAFHNTEIRKRLPAGATDADVKKAQEIFAKNVPKPIQETGASVLGGMGDIAASIGQGFTSLGEGAARLVGANKAADAAQKATEWLQSKKDNYTQYESKKLSEAIAKAEASGSTWEEIKAYADLVATQPIDTIAQVVGGLGVGGTTAKVGAKVALKAIGKGAAKEAAELAAKRGAQIGGGAAFGVMGAGEVASSQYETTFNAAKSLGLADEQAKQLAEQAVSEGRGMQALGGALGVAGAALGPLERVATGTASKAGGATIGKALGGVAIEGTQEFTEEAQSKLAGNKAAIDQGVMSQDNLMRGVVGAGVAGALVGAPLGGIAGGIESGNAPSLPSSSPAASAGPAAGQQVPTASPPVPPPQVAGRSIFTPNISQVAPVQSDATEAQVRDMVNVASQQSPEAATAARSIWQDYADGVIELADAKAQIEALTPAQNVATPIAPPVATGLPASVTNPPVTTVAPPVAPQANTDLAAKAVYVPNETQADANVRLQSLIDEGYRIEDVAQAHADSYKAIQNPDADVQKFKDGTINALQGGDKMRPTVEDGMAAGLPEGEARILAGSRAGLDEKTWDAESDRIRNIYTEGAKNSLDSLVGKAVEYQGLAGIVEKDAVGYHVNSSAGRILIESGMSGARPETLGVSVLPDARASAIRAGLGMDAATSQVKNEVQPKSPTSLEEEASSLVAEIESLFGLEMANRIIDIALSRLGGGVNFRGQIDAIREEYNRQLEEATSPRQTGEPAGTSGAGESQRVVTQNESEISQQAGQEVEVKQGDGGVAPQGGDSQVQGDANATGEKSSVIDWEASLKRAFTALDDGSKIVFATGRGRQSASAKAMTGIRRRRFTDVVRVLINGGMPPSLVAKINRIGDANSGVRGEVAGVLARSIDLVTYKSFWKDESRDILPHVVAHELGHILDIENGSVGRISFTSDWDNGYDDLIDWYRREVKAGNKGHTLSYPFRVSVNYQFLRKEAFAQAVGLYFSDNAALLANAPDAHRAVADAIDSERKSNDRAGVSSRNIQDGESAISPGQVDARGATETPPVNSITSENIGSWLSARRDSGGGDRPNNRGEVRLPGQETVRSGAGRENSAVNLNASRLTGDVVGAQLSRSDNSATGNIVSAIHAAIDKVMGRGASKKMTAVKVVQSVEDVPAGYQQSIVDAKGQAYFDPNTGDIVLIADRIKSGEGMAVLLHEIGHKRLLQYLGTVAMRSLRKGVEAWKNAPEGSNERKVWEAANKRAQESGDFENEIIPYAIEEAEKLGILPDLNAPAGTVARWLATVKQLVSKVIARLFTGKVPDLTVQDLSAIARGAAGLELENLPTEGVDRSGEVNFSRQTAQDAVSQSQDIRTYKAPKDQVKPLADRITQKFVDSLLPVKRFLEGLPIGELGVQRLVGDLYRQAGIRANLEKEAKEKFWLPLVDSIKKFANDKGLTYDQARKLLDEWARANYAKEGNAVLNAKAIANGQAGHTGGWTGGLSDQDAAAILNNYNGQFGESDIRNMYQHLRAMLDWKLDLDESSGKVDPVTAAQWRKEMPNYVPTTGDPRTELDAETSMVRGSGGLNQSKDKSREGRTSLSDDPSLASIEATVKSIAYASWNDFKSNLNDLWQQTFDAYVNQVHSVKDATALTSQTLGYSRTRETAMTRSSDNVIIYRKGGKAWSFKFDDGEIISAIKREGEEDMPALLMPIAAGTRLFSRLVTQFMPFFGPVNMIRDIWEKSELIRTRKVVDANGNKVDMNKVARSAIANSMRPDIHRATWAKAFDKQSNSPAFDELEKMIELGGQSTWGDYFSKRKNNLPDMLGSGSAFAKAGEKAKIPLDKLADVAESYNNAFELVSGVSIFKALKDAGVSEKDAASATLDLMNFRKRGEWSFIPRALYAFANPIAQGSANLAGYLNTRQGKIRLAAYTIGFMALYAALSEAAGEDETGRKKMDTLGSWATERSILVPIGGDKFIKVPVGFGPAQFALGFAVNFVKTSRGELTSVDMTAELVRHIMKSVSPVGPSEIAISKYPADFLMSTFSPTIAKGVTAVATDRSNFGNKLTPAFKNQNKLESDSGGAAIPQFYKDVAKEMQRIGLGDHYPEQVKAIMDSLVVGPLRYAATAAQNERNKEMGRAQAPNLEAPFVAKYNDASPIYLARSESDELRQLKNEIASREQAGEKAIALTEEQKKKLSAFETYEKESASLRARLSNASKRSNGNQKAVDAERVKIAKDQEQAAISFVRRLRIVDKKLPDNAPVKVQLQESYIDTEN
jgi:hypothetical protein